MISFLDLSGNGNFADEASLIIAATTVVGLFYGGARISRRVRRIDHAVNNVHVPITDDATATLGQRVVRIEGTNDEQQKVLRVLSESLNDHVRISNMRHERIEQKLDRVMEALHDVRKIAG